MSESPEREREIAAGAVAEMAKRHKQQGNNMAVLCESMIALGRRGLSGMIGEPTAGAYRGFVEDAYNAAPDCFDASELGASFALHGALTCAARDGAEAALSLLKRIEAMIQEGVGERRFRSGDPRKDAN